jgi:hypothetical protein
MAGEASEADSVSSYDESKRGQNVLVDLARVIDLEARLEVVRKQNSDLERENAELKQLLSSHVQEAEW